MKRRKERSVSNGIPSQRAIALRGGRINTDTGMMGMSTANLLVTAGVIALALQMPAAGQTTNDAAEVRVAELPPGVPIQRHYFNPTTGEHRQAGGGLGDDNLVYANTPPPTTFLPLLAGVRVADDIRTIAAGGCNISAYEVQVTGGGDGTGLGFGVDFALYDSCPSDGGQVIPGTAGTVTVDNDGVSHILVDLRGSPISLGNRFWIGVSFSRAGPGWLLGTAADIGLTEDVYDAVFTPCTASFEGTTLHAGFGARVWCAPPFDTEFLAYSNENVGDGTYGAQPDLWYLDDVELVMDDCILSSLEVAGRGHLSLPTKLSTEVRRFCGPSTAVQGTRRSGALDNAGASTLLRFEYPGGIDLGGGTSFFVGFRYDESSTHLIAGEAELGFTDSRFRLQTVPGGCLLISVFNEHVGLPIAIRCLGPRPMGACCDGTNPGPQTCTETTAVECQGPGKHWLPRTLCDGPAGPPCNLAACCTPPNAPMGEGCRDMSQAECESIVDDQGNPAVWQSELFCGDPGQDCIHWVCRHAEGACAVPNGTPGCNSPSCCDRICDQDPFCCAVQWDEGCAERALGPDGCSIQPPANDDCYGPLPGSGAVMMNECSGGGAPCATHADCPPGQTCDANGSVPMINETATPGPHEELCCHPEGAGLPGTGGVWAKFVASETSARVHTCSAIAGNATNSILQVFKALNHAGPEAACNSLIPIGCGTDGGCEAGHASVCLYNLVIGETYYVLMASATPATAGHYLATVTSPASGPCPTPGGPPHCPAGEIDWIDPPDGVVDARQPHAPHDANALRGIDQLSVGGPIGTTPDCWTLCDDTGTNAVLMVEPSAICGSTLHLARPITAGAVTHIVYAGDGNPGAFTAHPGNVDASDATDPGDIISLIDMLNQVRVPPWGLYSCDVDHGGTCGPSDIIGVIDLLNGANAFTSWMGTPLPPVTGGCP